MPIFSMSFWKRHHKTVHEWQFLPFSCLFPNYDKQESVPFPSPQKALAGTLLSSYRVFQAKAAAPAKAPRPASSSWWMGGLDRFLRCWARPSPHALTKRPGEAAVQGAGNKHTRSPGPCDQLSELVYVFLFHTVGGQKAKWEGWVFQAWWPPLRWQCCRQPWGPSPGSSSAAVGTVGPAQVPVACPAPPCTCDFILRCLGPGGRWLPSPQPVWSLSHWVPPPGTF